MPRTSGPFKKVLDFVKRDLSRTEANHRKFLREQRPRNKMPGQLKTALRAPDVLIRESLRDAKIYTQKVTSALGKVAKPVKGTLTKPKAPGKPAPPTPVVPAVPAKKTAPPAPQQPDNTPDVPTKPPAPTQSKGRVTPFKKRALGDRLAKPDPFIRTRKPI